MSVRDGRSVRSSATRRKVVAAAQELFVRDGYAATSVEAIARAAGVGVQTVYYGFGTKRALLAACLDSAIAGDDAPVPATERAWVRAALAEPDPVKRLFRQVRSAADVLGRAGGLLDVVRGAASMDPDLRELWVAQLEQRMAVQRVFVNALAQEGLLREGLTRAAAVDASVLILGPESWTLLVAERGWTTLRWARWAHRQLVADLLGQLLPDGD
ncbi:TetR/AcrR family transcriptional regulator [Cellulomonas hominis]